MFWLRVEADRSLLLQISQLVFCVASEETFETEVDPKIGYLLEAQTLADSVS